MVMFASKYIADTDDVEDLVQETFVALWNNRNQLRSATAIKSYLYTTLRNKSLNFLRNSKSNKSNSDELLRLEADDDFADEIIKEETFRLFYQAIDDLNENAKKVVLLTLEGYSRQDIAEEMGITIDTVKYHKKSALNKLKEKLEGHFYLLILLT